MGKTSPSRSRTLFLYLYEDEHDALPPMNHNHDDYCNNDYNHGHHQRPHLQRRPLTITPTPRPMKTFVCGTRPPPASLPPQDTTRADDTTYVGITATPIDSSTPPLKRPQAAVPTPDRYNLPEGWDSKSGKNIAISKPDSTPLPL